MGVLPYTGGSAGSILGSCMPILGWSGLPVDLLHSCTGLMVASERAWVVGMPGSVVGPGVTDLLAAFGVPRRTGKRVHFHLMTA